MSDKSKHERPEAYPKPTETDRMVANQPEYVDNEPNSYTKEVSNVPAEAAREEREKNSPRGE